MRTHDTGRQRGGEGRHGERTARAEVLRKGREDGVSVVHPEATAGEEDRLALESRSSGAPEGLQAAGTPALIGRSQGASRGSEHRRHDAAAVWTEDPGKQEERERGDRFRGHRETTGRGHQRLGSR